ncbi:hypothetical protein [Yoonia sediminilitoris]|nr:hypothetical protein [Yoonia sediminilitoris]
MKHFFSIASLAILSGCGGGGGSSDQETGPDDPLALSAEEVALLRMPEDVTFDIRSDEVWVAFEGLTTNLDLQPNPPSAQFRAYSGGRGGSRLLIGETPSQTAQAFLLFSSGSNGIGASGTRLVRLTDTSVPEGGSAIYLGEYVGSYSAGFNASGDVRLTADFGRSSISGTITNRQLEGANIGGRPAEDVLLTEATIIDGAFSGETSGGRDLFLTEEPTGSYEGLLVGGDADGAIGAVRIVHANGDEEPTIEWGLFWAEE